MDVSGLGRIIALVRGIEALNANPLLPLDLEVRTRGQADRCMARHRAALPDLVRQAEADGWHRDRVWQWTDRGRAM